MLKAGDGVHNWEGMEQNENGTWGNRSLRGRRDLENASSSKVSQNCGIA